MIRKVSNLKDKIEEKPMYTPCLVILYKTTETDS